MKDYRLTLPTGDLLVYPTPNAGGLWEAGSNALIQHPAAPEIERSSEEAAADAAAGRQWWNKAILAWNSLHGKNIGGWIYIDSAGACWRVTTTLSALHMSGGTAEVKLKRFGLLGGSAEEHTYSVSVPNMGQGSPAIEGSNGSYLLTRYHTNKVGSAAVFELAVGFSGDRYAHWPRRPCGWVEIKLSGPGAECVISVATVKNRAETLGSATTSELTRIPDNWYVQEHPAESKKRLTQTPLSGFTTFLLVQHEAVSGIEARSYTGYTVGMFYDDAGLHELTISEQAQTSYSSPPAIHSGPVEFDFNAPVTGSWYSSTSFTTSLRIIYAIDGEEVCTYDYSAVQTSSQTGTITNGASNIEFTWSVSYAPGGVSSGSGNIVWVVDGVGALGGDYTARFSTAMSDGAIPRDMGGNGIAYRWSTSGTARTMRLFPHRHANTLFGNCERYTDPPATSYPAAVATPVGALSLPVFVGGSDQTVFVYGSWCPVTGQAVRALEPVCWV
ncbi:hypothetical protein [Pseudomonas turukhanskensis]|uniref:hypothetical protein n=1 Tax=Pseudomonas turukhanskensis TaxID=1806536 RepID=UPI0022F2DD1A|nr:hypothetical protein [Pseudomonas turukhanskensis]